MKIIVFQAKRARTHRRRRRNWRPLFVAVVGLCLLSAIGFGVYRLVDWLRPNIQEDAGITYIGDLPVHEDFVSPEAVGRPGGVRDIRYIVIHETDNFAAGANAEAHNHFIHENAMTEKLSWHYTVDDHEVYHHIPDSEPAYHAGDGMEEGGGNMCGIGIELCVAEDNDYEKTLENGALLAAQLMVSYDLTPDDLRKHQDFSGKVCPARMINENRWDAFAQMVSEQYERLKAENEQN